VSTITFGIDGESYESDLSNANAGRVIDQKGVQLADADGLPFLENYC
jgi:hypothetical protein